MNDSPAGGEAISPRTSLDELEVITLVSSQGYTVTAYLTDKSTPNGPNMASPS